MAVRQSTAGADVAARELKESMIRQIKDQTGVDTPRHQTVDQLIRTAYRHGVRFTLVSYMA
jgi:hypothetical protein